MAGVIHVAFSLADDIGATLADRARAEGFVDLSEYLRSLAEADARGEQVWQVSPEIARALEEGERSGYVPYDPDRIFAEARARFFSE